MTADQGSTATADSAPVEVETVLAPVDGSDASVTALEYASAIADRYDAAVHAV